MGLLGARAHSRVKAAARLVMTPAENPCRSRCQEAARGGIDKHGHVLVSDLPRRFFFGETSVTGFWCGPGSFARFFATRFGACLRSLPSSSERTRPLAPAAKKTQRQGLFCMEAAPLVFATVFSVALHAFSSAEVPPRGRCPFRRRERSRWLARQIGPTWSGPFCMDAETKQGSRLCRLPYMPVAYLP